MFSIYGLSGNVFHGTLEEMNRVRALARTRSVRGVIEDGEELDELDSEQETTSGLSIPFFEFQQEIFLLKKQGSVIQELQVLCSSAIQITYPRLHIQHCLYRI